MIDGAAGPSRSPVPPRLLAVVIAVAALWLVIALARHHGYASTLFDLGLFDQIVWNTSHGRFFACSVHRAHFFADHFGPALALVAPLYWLRSDPTTLLAVDVACVASASVPLFLAARTRGLSAREASLLVVVFLAYPTSTCVAIYDFHPDMLALPCMMTALFAQVSGRPALLFAAALAALGCKEEYAVWCTALGLFTGVRSANRPMRLAGSALALFAPVYLVVVIGLVIPHYNGGGMSQLSRYGYLGHGPVEALRNVATNPALLLHAITPLKLLHLAITFASLAYLPLRRPAYLAIALPCWAYNLLSTHENQSFVHYQNMVPVLGPLFFATLDALARPADGRQKKLRLLLGVAPANLVLVGVIEWWLWGRLSFPDGRAVGVVAAQLPADASLSTTNTLGPHFSERPWLSLFPRLRPMGAEADVDFILVPVGPEGFRHSAKSGHEMAGYLRDALGSGYAPVAIEGDVVLLRRGAEAEAPLSATLDQLLESLDPP